MLLHEVATVSVGWGIGFLVFFGKKMTQVGQVLPSLFWHFELAGYASPFDWPHRGSRYVESMDDLRSYLLG